jgi:light-regulated signal transduction histidine kinase (bacteriophytochrome)
VLNAGAIVDGPPMTILEFEPLDDQVNPLSPPVSRPKAEQRRSGMRERNNGSSTAGESKGSKGSKGSKDSNGGGSGGTVGRARGPDEFSGSTLEAPEEEGTPANSPTGGEGRSTSSVATPRSSSPRPMITTIDSDGLTVTGTAEHVPLDTDAGPGGLEGEAFVPSHEAFLESTESTSRPIRALHRMHSDQDGSSRRRPRPTRGSRGAGPGLANRGEGTGGGGPQMLDMFGVLSQVNEQLSAQSDLNGFLKVVVSIIREVTGFGRVMVYQFDEAWNGQVVCELVDWQETHDLYRGLHFPATDIPKQARDLYLINKVRLLYDRDQPSARMVCRTQEDLAHPVDMTHSFLRAMSPIHIKYLANMGVRASMSISIVAFDQLWGLIALHTYGSHGKRVAFPMRQLCRLIGESVSRNIERLSYTRRLSARKLINTLPTDQNPSGYIISNAEDLLKLFDADFGVIAIGNEAKILGPLSASQEVLGCTEYLRIKKFQRVIVSQDVSKDFPDMVLPKGLEVIAGILLVPLSNSGIDFIAFLRKAQTRSVNWAGKPFKEGKENSAVLEPRKSFKIWSETVTGTCRAWKDEELETAGVLCLVYGKFISVWRQREQAMQYNQLNKLLLSNASHEVRTPLNHIINYLEMALDGNLDEDTRDHLSKSHMASKSLLFVINDLLDLTRQEQGNKLFLQEPFDLAATVREAVEMHQWEAKRRKIDFSVDTQPETCMVLGDKNRIRSILINTVTNSVKHTSEGHIHVEMRKRASMELSELPEDCDMEIELVVSDSGTGIPREKLESIFREFEQVESVIAEPKLSQDGKPEERSATEDLELGATADAAAAQESGSALGLGLAVVARIVRNLGGQLRVDSTVGEGSRFTYFLPFRSADHLQGVSEPQRGGGSSQGGSGTSMRRSNSLGSDGSQASSNKSEINSLVEAISASHLDSHNSDGAQAGPDSARGKEPGGRKNAGMVGSLSSSAGRSRPDLQRMQSSADSSGSRPIAGSSIPLRSVKIDPHELDSLPQSPRQADSRRQHGERRSSREHDRRRSGVTRNTAEATGGTAGPSASPTVHAQDHEPTAHTQNVEGPTVTAAPDSPSSGLAQTSRREPPPGRVNVKAVNRDAAASGHMNNDSGSDATPPDGRSPGSASGGARHSGARSRRLAAAQKARTSPAVTPAAPPQKLAPLRVLVVEDDPINRAILAKRLGKDNHTVLLAVNGEEGVRVFEEQGDSIDVVLMDLQMPICNGQDACVRIREAERKRTDSRTLAGRPAAHILNGCIPILAVSATLSYDMREEIAELGFDGWLLKPIDFKRLHSLLKSLTHPEHRQTEQWKPGHAWEKGGWLSVPPSRAQDDDGGDEAGSPAA